MKPTLVFSFLLITAIAFPSLVRLQAAELITNGNFESLENWVTQEMDTRRDLVESNSPFVDCYPSNGKAVKISGQTVKRADHLVQKVAPQSTGRVRFQIDLSLPPGEGDASVAGWNVILFDEASPKSAVAGFSISSRFRLRDEKGIGGKILLHKKTNPGEWLHFTGVLDFSTRKWSGSLRTQNGSEEIFTDLPFLAEGAQAATVGGISVRSMNPAVEPTPLLVDNISLISEAPKQESEPSIEKP